MTTRKRNQYLDLPSDEEDVQAGYESDDLDNSRLARTTKRRRVSAADNNDDEDDISDEDVDAIEEESNQAEDQDEDDVSDADEDEHVDTVPAAGAASAKASKSKSQPKKQQPLRDDPISSSSHTTALTALARKAASQQSKSLKTGVCYLSRIPPFLKPSALRSLLIPYAPHGLNRLFLTPEDPVLHKQRVRSGGNKKRTFTDGWVEFNSKRDAKIAAETLNANIIGGKKGGWYHDDVWNIKYLKGFKWRHLTEQINAENAERAARLRTEIARTTRENKAFVANVERAKKEEGIRVTRKKRGDVEDDRFADEDVVDTERDIKTKPAVVKEGKQRPQHFRQNEVKGQAAKGVANTAQSEEVMRVLSKIF